MLKHLPVANLNQVKDTKVLKVINKWAKKSSVSCGPEEETSSSDVDSRGLSPPDTLDDASRRETHISSSSDELQNSSKSIEMQKPAENDCSKSDIECRTVDQNEKTAESSPMEDTVFEPGEIRSDEELKPEGDKPEGLKSEVLNSEGQKPEGLKSEEVKPEEQKSEGLKSEGLKPHRVKDSRRHKRSMYSRIVERIGDSSEEESSRWSEDDITSSDSESIVDLAADLLDQWSSLKVMYLRKLSDMVCLQNHFQYTMVELITRVTRIFYFLVFLGSVSNSKKVYPRGECFSDITCLLCYFIITFATVLVRIKFSCLDQVHLTDCCILSGTAGTRVYVRNNRRYNNHYLCNGY